jgi:hypothetical protein
MQWDRLIPAMFLVALVVAFGVLFTTLSIVSMRVAYRRAYTEIASSCQEVSVLTVGGLRYFCAPVVRIESADASPATPVETDLTLL